MLDEAACVELHAKWAPNIVTALGRLAGRTVGVIANNPLRLGGCLDSTCAEKAARFVRMCDAFGVPLVVLVDVPGYLPGVGQEWDGVVRRGAKLLHAFAEAVGAAGHAGDAQGVRRRVHRHELPRRWARPRSSPGRTPRSRSWARSRRWASCTGASWPPPRRTSASALQRARRRSTRSSPAGVERALELGVVDEVIEPAETRGALAEALAAATPGRGAHGNIPLDDRRPAPPGAAGHGYPII